MCRSCAAQYELWHDLEQSADIQLLYTTGSIDAGPSTSGIVAGSQRSCVLHDLDHEVLTAGELERGFPGYSLPAEYVAVVQPQGGFLLPELCMSSHIIGAQAAGAKVHAREQVLGWEACATMSPVRQYLLRRPPCRHWTWGFRPETVELSGLTLTGRHAATMARACRSRTYAT